MIQRYTRPEMGRLWDEENKYRIWMEIEILATEAQADLGVVPKEAADTVRKKARFTIPRILELEKEVKHDVIAFLTCLGEHIGPESRYVHLGMTSSDVLDTCLAVQIRHSGDLLLKGLEQFRAVLARRAVEFKRTLMVGRSHGVHAEPVTFGLKLALWYEEIGRQTERLSQATTRAAVGKISGAVGTFAHIDPRVESHVCRALGIGAEPIATQVVQRDRHAEFLSVLALIAGTLEKIAVEVRHLQRTEVLEAEEYFSEGQKGSSAMPHKRNPIVSERITGLARVIRSNAMAAMENIALWHERDISHSSVERIIFPDSCIALDFILNDAIQLIDRLLVYPERMKKNLDITGGLIFSQEILLALIKKGLKREEAYRLVQKHAMAAWEDRKDFIAGLIAEPAIVALVGEKELRALSDPAKMLKNIDILFERIGLS